MDGVFMEKLFDGFKQESAGLERSYDGTGLGLTLVKRWVDLLKAEIRVESEKGKGTTFNVIWPVDGKSS